MDLSKLEFNNFFYTALNFGNAEILKLVVAKDTKDAIETIKVVYPLAKLSAIFSFEELRQYDLETKENPKIIYISEQITKESGDFSVHTIKEDELSFNDVIDKYKNKESVVLNAEKIQFLITVILNWIKEDKESPLISKNF